MKQFASFSVNFFKILFQLLCSFLTILIIVSELGTTAEAFSGKLDPTFGTDGKVNTDFGLDESACCVTLQPDGNILVGGGMGVVRYRRDGQMDLTFGQNGRASAKPPLQDINAAFFANGLILQPDGRIIVAGFLMYSVKSDIDFMITRYYGDGSLDTSFGNSGFVITDFFGEYDVAGAVALQSDGKIIQAGIAYQNQSSSYVGLVRYNADGSLDTSFGKEGKSITGNLNFLNVANALVIQRDGKIVVAGTAVRNQVSTIGLLRFNRNGTVDKTFGDDGLTITALENAQVEVTSLVAQNYKILVAGTISRENQPSDMILARYDFNGSLDRRFGYGGKVTTDFFHLIDGATSIAVQPDDQIVVVGLAENSESGSDFGIVRYHEDGSLDRRFGREGKVVTDFFGLGDYSCGVTIQPDGRILLAGWTFTGQSIDIALSRYLP